MKDILIIKFKIATKQSASAGYLKTAPTHIRTRKADN